MHFRCLPMVGALTLSLFATGCAHQTPTNQATLTSTTTRLPASIERNDEFESIFQEMLQSSEIEQNIYLKMNQIEYAYYKSAQAQEELDALLLRESSKPTPTDDFSKLAFQVGISPRLAAAQAFGRLAHEQMRYHFLRLVETANDPATPEDVKARVNRGFVYLEKYLRQAPLSFRLVFNTWMEDLHEVVPDSPVLQAANVRMCVGDPEALMALAGDPAVVAHKEKMVKKLAHLTDPLMDDLIHTFTVSQKSDFEESRRSPQAVDTVVKASQLPAKKIVLVYEGTLNHAYSLQLATYLTALKVPTAFFLVGDRFDKNSPVAQSFNLNPSVSLQSAGMREFEMPKLFDQEINDHLTKSRLGLSSIGGSPRFLRPAFGAESARVRDLAARQDFKIVRTSIPSLDWVDQNPTRVAQRIFDQVKLNRGGIVALRLDLPHGASVLYHLIELVNKTAGEYSFASLAEVSK